MEGLFRVPGPAAYTEYLTKGFEEGALTSQPLLTQTSTNMANFLLISSY